MASNKEKVEHQVIECIKNGHFLKAVHFLSVFISKNTSNMDHYNHYFLRSFCYQQLVSQQESLSLALDDSLTAIRINTKRYECFLQSAFIYTDMKMYEMAEKHFSKVIQMNANIWDHIKDEYKFVAFMTRKNQGISEKNAFLTAIKHKPGKTNDDLVQGSFKKKNVLQIIECIQNEHKKNKIKMQKSIDGWTQNENSMIDGWTQEQNSRHKIVSNKSPTKESLEQNSDDFLLAAGSSRRNNDINAGDSKHKDMMIAKSIQVLNFASEKPVNLFQLNGIWISGLKFELDDEELTKFFLKFGKILNFLKLKNAGFAFIHYNNPSSPVDAIFAVNNTFVDGISFFNLKLRFAPSHKQKKRFHSMDIEEYKRICNDAGECHLFRSGKQCKSCSFKHNANNFDVDTLPSHVHIK